MTVILDEMDIPNYGDSLDDTVIKLLGLMRPIIADIADNEYHLCDMMDETSSAFIQNQRLIESGLASIGALGTAMEQERSNMRGDWPKVKSVFWDFLKEQLRVRSETLKVVCESADSWGGDSYMGLYAQIYELSRLQELYAEFRDWKCPALKEDRNGKVHSMK